MTVADHDIITQRYFFPRRQSPPDATIVDLGEAELACHHAERGHDVTVLHFHGNGELAARYPGVAGLILESGIADVLERILLRASPAELGTTRDAMEDEFAKLFDHERKLGEFGGPTLVLHAERDHLVDKSHAERNAAWAGADAELVLFPRGDHNSIFHSNREAYLEALQRFLEGLGA